MIEFTETTIAMVVAVLGVIGTLIWYALAWYGLTTLQDIRDAVTPDHPTDN